jgi:hypothetical protein
MAFYDFRHDDAVTLVVGPDQKKILVQGNYLTRNSEYFNVALKKEWLEGETRTITLLECPDVMAHYITFAYEGKLSTSHNCLTAKADFEHCYRLLAELYVYGEKFLNPSIKKAVILEFFRLMGVRDASGLLWCPSNEEVNTIYRGTPEHSPARRLMVDTHVTKGGKFWLHDGLKPAFLVDLAKTLYDRALDHITCNHSRSYTLTPKDYFG